MAFVAQSDVFSPRLPRRSASLGLVLLLHLLILAMLLMQTGEKFVRPEGERETVLPLTPLSRAPFARTRAVRRPATPQAIALPQTIPPALRLPNARDIAGLGRTLSDCTPEKLSSLPEDERAKCAMALGGPAGKGAAPYKRPASQSRYRALWAATLAQRETPVRVPCATVKTLHSAPGMPDLQRSQAIIVDPICATQELLKALER